MEILQIKITLSYLLLLQLAFCILGIGFNAVSYFLVRSCNGSLTPNPPVAGLMVLSIYGISLIVGFCEFYTIYRSAMAIFLVLIGYFGVLRHITKYIRSPELYKSLLFWLGAVRINSFGTLLNFMAATGRFTTTMT